jgi:hypothetical protein
MVPQIHAISIFGYSSPLSTQARDALNNRPPLPPAGEAILKCYTDESQQQLAGVIRTIIESSLAQALARSQKQFDGWMKGVLDGTIRNAQDGMVAVTADFRVKLLGAWSYLLWNVFAWGASFRLRPAIYGVLVGKDPVSVRTRCSCERDADHIFARLARNPCNES